VIDLVLEIFIIGSLAAGCFLALTGALGLVRFPDFFTRLHPAGTTGSLALLMIVAALLAHIVREEHGPWIAGRVVLVAVIVLVTASVATHAVSKAAVQAGLQPHSGRDNAPAKLRGKKGGQP
jgi:multicomponent Na+:H+ antiporter subunit G